MRKGGGGGLAQFDEGGVSPRVALCTLERAELTGVDNSCMYESFVSYMRTPVCVIGYTWAHPSLFCSYYFGGVYFFVLVSLDAWEGDNERLELLRELTASCTGVVSWCIPLERKPEETEGL
jgi:hypothetical protein